VLHSPLLTDESVIQMFRQSDVRLFRRKWPCVNLQISVRLNSSHNTTNLTKYAIIDPVYKVYVCLYVG
jgi:hypothetical protein